MNLLDRILEWYYEYENKAPVTTPGKFAIVRLPATQTQLKTDPATVPLTDAKFPKENSTKGTPIKILKWEDYVKRINVTASWRWLLKPYMMWINRVDKKAEQIVCSCNFVRIIDETETHYEIEALFNDIKTSNISTSNLNWMKTPWLIHQALSRNGQTNQLFLVANGKYVYFPILKTRANPHMYIRKDRVELFPTILLDGRVIVSFALQGASVWGTLTDGNVIPLRLNPTRDSYLQDPNWPLQHRGAIPPV